MPVIRIVITSICYVINSSIITEYSCERSINLLFGLEVESGTCVRIVEFNFFPKTDLPSGILYQLELFSNIFVHYLSRF